MVDNHYRWDFIGLSTDSKPTAASEKVVDGSTFYEANTSKIYVWCNNQWYEKTATGGGGGGGGDYTFETFTFTLVDDTTVDKSIAVETSEGE